MNRRLGRTAVLLAAAAIAAAPAVGQSLPSLAKSISPTSIASGGTAVLTFTVTNPAGAPAVSDVGFTDTLSAGLVVAAPSNVGGTCANAAAATTAVSGGGTITTSNLQVPAGASACTVAVNITNASGFAGTCPDAARTNDAGNVQVANVANDVQPSCLTVVLPTLAKAFSPTTIAAGGTSTLTFTITNPAGNPMLANVGFTDTLPSGVMVANPPNTGGTCANAAAATTAIGGGGTITVTNLQVPAGAASCTVTVNVANAAGEFGPCPAVNRTNDAANVQVTNVANAVQPSCLTVQAPTLTKAFSPTAIDVGGTTTLTFTVTNPAGSPPLTDVGFTDTLPSSLVIATPPATGGTCANAAAATTAVAGGSAIVVTNLQVPAGASSCTVTVNVTSGRGNPSCAANPSAFTNSGGNLTVSNVSNAVTPSCVTVGPALQPAAAPALSPTVLVTAVALLALIALAGVRRLGPQRPRR